MKPSSQLRELPPELCEGLKLVQPALEPYVMPITIVILLALFAVQSRGTASVASFFGPVMLVWFATLALLGVLHIGDAPVIFYALNPLYGERTVAREDVAFMCPAVSVTRRIG